MSEYLHITSKTTDLWRVSREYSVPGLRWFIHLSEHDDEGSAIRIAARARSLGAQNITVTGPYKEPL